MHTALKRLSKYGRLYSRLYRILGSRTPLRFDCGRMCQNACCQSGERTCGMYLFPGEEALLRNAPGFTILPTELPGYGAVSLLVCRGTCKRALRPLACRIFPLAPMLNKGDVQVRMDARGRAVCPLCAEQFGALDPRFVRAVQRVFTTLAKRKTTAGFLQSLCDQNDTFNQPFL